MRIRLLGKSLVPYTYATHATHSFELMVHGVELRNDADDVAEVRSVELILEKGRTPVASLTFEETRLREVVEQTARALAAARVTTDDVLGVCFSRGFPRGVSWSGATALAPGEALALGWQLLSVRDVVPTRLVVSIRTRTEESRRSFRLQEYRCRNRYVFPVPGRARCYNGPAGGGSHHRRTTTQEFAYDILPVNSRMTMVRGKGERYRDYPGFRAPVVAPAPGKVVVSLDGMPENERIGAPPELTAERVEQWGMLHAAAGNVVVIEHRHGEHSLLAHLACGSLLVGEGDRVRRGQRVGLLGNTGNSTAPHLHYQLMDGPDFLRSRSLPVRFSDVGDLFPSGDAAGEYFSARDPFVTTLG